MTRTILGTVWQGRRHYQRRRAAIIAAHGGGIQTLLEDTFSGTNGDPIDGRTPDTKTPEGVTWDVLFGDAADVQIQSNKLQRVARGATPRVMIVANCGESDVTVSTTESDAAGGDPYQSFILRQSASNANCWLGVISYNDQDIRIQQHFDTETIINRAFTSYPSTPDPTPFTFQASGDDLTLTVGAKTATYNSSAYNTNTLVGMEIGSSSSFGGTFDNIKVTKP